MIKIIIMCSFLAVIVFGLQLLLCLKGNRKFVKHIPVCLIVAFYALAIALCLIDVLDGSGGVAIWMIFAFIIAIANTVAFAADITAWIVYRHTKKDQ